MIELDFYHRCWLELKQRNPRLRKRMDEVEVTLAGLQKPIPFVPYAAINSDKKSADNEPPEKIGKIV